MAPETARQERKPTDLPRLKALLAPYPSGQITCWSVSARVGNVKNNAPSLKSPSQSMNLSIFSRPPRNPETTNRPGSRNRI